MQIHNKPQQTNFNGQLIIGTAPKLFAKGNDLMHSNNGIFLKLSSREVLNIDSGEVLNTLTRRKMPGNPAIKYFLNLDGDVYKTFNVPIKTTPLHEKSLRMIGDQISPKLDLGSGIDSKITHIVQVLKDKGLIDKILIENIKAERIFRKLEDIVGEHISVGANQPKYFINCKDKMFLIADYAKGASNNGIVIKHIFDEQA